MIRFHWKKTVKNLCVVGLMALAVRGTAQYPPGSGMGGPTGGGVTGVGTTGGMGSGPTSIYNFHTNYHLGFDKPEAWGLKYFASASLFSGLQPPPPSEGYHVGSIALGFEADWLPQLSTAQRTIGFNGTTPEDLNKAPIFARVILRVGLPDQFTAMVAAPPPFHSFGITSHLLEFGLERPLIRRNPWMVNWRGYAQVGSVKGAFTCPASVVSFAPGSPKNPTECVGESADIASLRYAGSEFQLAYQVPSMPKLIPHVRLVGTSSTARFRSAPQWWRGSMKPAFGHAGGHSASLGA